MGNTGLFVIFSKTEIVGKNSIITYLQDMEMWQNGINFSVSKVSDNLKFKIVSVYMFPLSSSYVFFQVKVHYE